LVIAVAFLFVFGVIAHGQDSGSLAEAARQAHQQKQTKDGQNKEATRLKTARVITNDEILGPSGPTTGPGRDWAPTEVESATVPAGAKLSAEQWKSRIRTLKNAIRSLQGEINRLNGSIHFAPANCVANCVQWNERQQRQQGEVERMRAQLEDQKKRLEDMQESARQQGYGSSVYDP
jgi:hypothetical protein